MEHTELLKKFELEHNELKKLHLRVVDAQDKFDRAADAAKCSTCDIGKADLKLEFCERYQNCRFGLRCGKVCKLYKELSQLKKDEDSLREKYALKVFSLLSDVKPDLMDRQDKTVLSWGKVYGKDFKAFEPGLKTALVALVEEVGGRYRIVES